MPEFKMSVEGSRRRSILLVWIGSVGDSRCQPLTGLGDWHYGSRRREIYNLYAFIDGEAEFRLEPKVRHGTQDSPPHLTMPLSLELICFP
jgi:hypothetical protein